MQRFNKRPVFTTGISSTILGIPVKTLIKYDSLKLTSVSRTTTGRRVYSEHDLFKILLIKHLKEEKKMSLSGIKYLLELSKKVKKAQNIDILTYVIPNRKMQRFINQIIKHN